ncbi:MAG: tRNA pseudouridine synthase B [Anaerolineaceae bacterium]|jgi:tRNA pseudouridine55 synthase|nr:tRNA pseudouridine(55) synthase TruB [Anaerolineae bacterium]MBL1171527.1 tRNA pseudouridine(55) synthase TruB [Chloroflexota bacterium]MBV6467140.1 tRNA pseudouridine synthase B [Anaerolineales bacterium]MCE7906189.1 tRNA pseudouridine(55) synthase TruB [Anaerolineae bacterium CFX3]MDL1925062.1 tRNA pseudouridine(55) synthase TruB [Anaerolineae bacterium AMX1]OQY81709.1 MAG: tRNA pseudouridine(55) synthase TruB [Anaerolineae bacterium UTCFX3]GER78532.1 tRNA pseudouridine(55) synthase TruB
MNSQDIKNAISGVLVVDKPVGMTSHDVVEAVRRGTGIRRAGHTGTLDPRASGVLVILIGPAVRLSEYVSASDKRYQAIIRLGSSTDTFDADGRFVQQSQQPVNVTEEQFEKILKNFEGEIEQTPPPYSAVKVGGRRAYDMARQGEEVELTPRKIQVHHLEVLEWAPPEAVVDVHCSSGTYVRSLANDIGAQLGTGAYLVGLRRTKSGRFSLRDATPLRKLQEAFQAGNWYQYLIPAAEALADWPAIELNPDEVEEVRHGHRVKQAADAPASEMVRGVSAAGELIALMIPAAGEDGSPEWQPKKVFFTSEAKVEN